MRSSSSADPVRLTRRREFVRVARRCRKAVTTGLVLQAAHAQPAGTGVRVGFTASRKVGNAVERNRARRRMRAAARDLIGNQPGSDIDYVLIARRAILDRPYDLLLDDLGRALAQVGRRLGSGR